jgi:hypothetical protein
MRTRTPSVFNYRISEKPNQVRFAVSQGADVGEIEIRNFATQFKTRPPLLPDIVDLCRTLQEKTNYHIQKLQKRHIRKIPTSPGEYAINVLDESGPFVQKDKPLTLPF